MSRKEPVRIRVRDIVVEHPDDIYESVVVKSGSGAVIRGFKRHIGRKAIVIIVDGDNVKY